MAKKKSFDQRLLWLAAAIVIVLATAIGLFIHFHNTSMQVTQSSSKTNLNNFISPPSTAGNNNVNENRKTSTTPSSTLNSGSSNVPSSSQSTFTVQIVNDSVSNGNLHVGTLVSGIQSGNCTLTASKQGQSTLQLGSSSVRLDVNNYDCGVFNIPTSLFPSNGNWQLTLAVSNNGYSSSSSVTITIPGN